MAEYIDRQAAIENHCRHCIAFGICAHGGGCFDAEMESLKTIPAADVVFVVHGEWVPKSKDGSWRVDTCSVCKQDTHYLRYAPAYAYCPNCGADTREDADGD